MENAGNAEALRESFHKLRKAARSDDDVAGWFAKHPECIPNLPEHLRPYVKLMRVTERCGLRYKKDEAGLVQHVSMRFSATLPASVMQNASVQAISELLGEKIELQNKEDENKVYSGEFSVVLEPAKWTYVITAVAMGALGNSTDLFKQLGEIEWQRCNFVMDWPNLKALYEADLLPSTSTEFFEWLQSKSQSSVVSRSLPSDVTL